MWYKIVWLLIKASKLGKELFLFLFFFLTNVCLDLFLKFNHEKDPSSRETLRNENFPKNGREMPKCYKEYNLNILSK